MDCFDGLVVSWGIGTKPDAALGDTMLDAATETAAGQGEHQIVHSDRRQRYR